MSTHIPQLSGPETAPASGNAPKQLIVFLHGLGADGNDLIALAEEYAAMLPDAHFLSPNAPFPCDMAPFGRQWFSLKEWTEPSMLKGLKEAEPILNHYIDSQLERFGLEDKALALVGFSQGTMTAMHTALRRPKPCAGILGYSGALVSGDSLDREIVSRPPICLIHGQMDMVVPFAMMLQAEKALQNAEIEVETHNRPLLGHGIDGQGITHGAQFLQRAFALV